MAHILTGHYVACDIDLKPFDLSTGPQVTRDIGGTDGQT